MWEFLSVRLWEGRNDPEIYPCWLWNSNTELILTTCCVPGSVCISFNPHEVTSIVILIL